MTQDSKRIFTFTHKGKVKKIDLSDLSDDEYNHFLNIKGIANKLNFLSAHNLEHSVELPSIIDLKSQSLQPHKLVSRKQKLVDELKKYKENHPDDVDKTLNEIKDGILKETSIAGEDFNSLKNKTLNEVLNMYIKEVENLNIQNVNNLGISKINKLTTDIDSLSKLINQPFREALIRFTNNIESKADEEVSISEINAMKLAAEERYSNLYSLLEKHANESQALKKLLEAMNLDLEQLTNNLDITQTEILNKIQTESGKKELEKIIDLSNVSNKKIDDIILTIKSVHEGITTLSNDEKDVLAKLQEMKPTEIKEILQDPEFKKVIDDILNKIGEVSTSNKSIIEKINELNNNNFGLNKDQQAMLDKLTKINFEDLTQKQLETLSKALENVNSLSKLSESDIKQLNKIINDSTMKAYETAFDVNTVKQDLIHLLNNLTTAIANKGKDNKIYIDDPNDKEWGKFEVDYTQAKNNPLKYYYSLITELLSNDQMKLYVDRKANKGMEVISDDLVDYINVNKESITKFINNWKTLTLVGEGISQKDYLDDEVKLIDRKLDFIITLLSEMLKYQSSIPQKSSFPFPEKSPKLPTFPQTQTSSLLSAPLAPQSSIPQKSSLPSAPKEAPSKIPPVPDFTIPPPPPAPKIPQPPKLKPVPSSKSLPSAPSKEKTLPSQPQMNFDTELLERIRNPKLKSVDLKPKAEPEPEPKSMLGQAVENALSKRREDIAPNDFDEGNEEEEKEENWADGVHSQKIFDLKDFLNYLNYK